MLGYSPLLSDVDILTLKNPFEHLYRDEDVEALSDGFDPQTAYGEGRVDGGQGGMAGAIRRAGRREAQHGDRKQASTGGTAHRGSAGCVGGLRGGPQGGRLAKGRRQAFAEGVGDVTHTALNAHPLVLPNCALPVTDALPTCAPLAPHAPGWDDVFDDPKMGWSRWAHSFHAFSLNSGLFYLRRAAWHKGLVVSCCCSPAV